MWPYWLLFLVPAFYSVIRLRQAKVPLAVHRLPDMWRVVFVLLALMIGLRHEVGGDWIIYIEMLESYTNTEKAAQFGFQDPAYILLNLLATWTGLGV